MTQLTALIAAICIHTTQIDTQDKKIACLDHYVNCIMNTDNVQKCKDKEPKWIRIKTK